MIAILMSVQPKYCELIARGDKTRELRKTKPKIATPFKVYIYCTKANTMGDFILCKSKEMSSLFGFNIAKGINKGFAQADDIHLKGKVIGEFICDEITDYPYEQYNDGEHVMPYGELERLCLDGIEVYDYLRTEDGYGWHITDFKLYDTPKRVAEFHKPCENSNNCLNKAYREAGRNLDRCFDCGNRLTRPPQSWCYVEELTK